MNQLKNKNIVIFGLGVSGISALKLLKKIGANVFVINSGVVNSWATSEILSHCSIVNCFSESDMAHQKVLSDADLLILSPGIPRDHKILVPIHLRKISIWSEIELAFQVIKEMNKLVPIIAITGTNGKTTTTTFIGEVLKTAHKKAFIGGNIGIPFCDLALELISHPQTYDYIVLELSSFQLESMIDFRPNIALILNLFQNHGERYSSIEEYGLAKFHLTDNMQGADTLIYPTDYPFINDWAQKQKCKKISFSTKEPKSDYSTENFKLPGHHNLVNLKFVTIVCDLLNLDQNLVQTAINQFKGVHHRVEFVPNKYNFKAFNDAKSTNWDATLTAVFAMEKIPGDLYLIIGGKKRGHGDSILPHLDQLKKFVKRFYLIGEMSHEIEVEIKGLVEYVKLEKLDEVVSAVIKEKFSGVLLYSPGFPSFDQYTNYAKRGEHFIQLLS